MIKYMKKIFSKTSILSVIMSDLRQNNHPVYVQKKKTERVL